MMEMGLKLTVLVFDCALEVVWEAHCIGCTTTCHHHDVTNVIQQVASIMLSI